MKYFGGKARVCKDIQKILNNEIEEGQTFLSPFVGGGWVEQYIKADKKIEVINRKLQKGTKVLQLNRTSLSGEEKF